MHVTIRQLRVFEAVATNLSFTKAADELHLTQPAVSMQVRQLEGAVGLPLFEVLGKKVFLTQGGTLLLEHARKVLAQLKLATSEMDQLKDGKNAEIRAMVTPTVNYLLPRLLAEFNRQYADLKVELEIADVDRLSAGVRANQTDLVFIDHAIAGVELITQPFAQNSFVIVAAPDHPLLNRKGPVSARLLSRERFVVGVPASPARTSIESYFRDKQISPVKWRQTSDEESVKQYVEAGQGIAAVSLHTVDLELAANRLAVLNVQGFPITSTWYVGFRDGKRLSTACEALIKFIVDEGTGHEHHRQNQDKPLIAERKSTKG